jgi:phosphopantetheine--protein transferase-like protein
MSQEFRMGVGVDIESIDRFRQLDKVKNRNFLDKIYTSHELEYCYTMNNAGPHLAGKFCGKEAVIKALTSIGHPGIHYNEIEITNAEGQAPKVSLLRGNRDVTLHISVSHSRDMAIALAIAIIIPCYLQ